MASSFRVEEFGISRDHTAIMFVVDDAFGGLCARVASRWFDAFETTDSSNLSRSLETHRPAAVVWPSQVEVGRSTEILRDQQVREARARLVPILAGPVDLLIGPIFGPGRSCANCWALRRAHETSLNITSSQAAPSIAKVAICAARILLKTESPEFTSPYILFNLKSRETNHGTLTSASECENCIRELRSRHNPNHELSQLISANLDNKGMSP
jgi:hypothetical protein